MYSKGTITVLAFGLGLIALSGCHRLLPRSYSGPLAGFAQKIDPVYSQYIDMNQKEEEAKSKGDVQKVQSLDMQIHSLLPHLKDAILEAEKMEKGKEIPFEQTGSKDLYTVTRIVFTGAHVDNNVGDVVAQFEGHADLKSIKGRWKTEQWKAVNKKGEVLASGPFSNTSNATSGPVIFYGVMRNLSRIDKDFDRIVIP